MAIEIYNTPAKKKQEFAPVNDNKISMYACGMTVYDMCHIGHARQQVVFDMIARYLRHQGYDLTYVRNFTDIDDKIIARANQDGVDFKEISEKYIAEFYTDMATLKVLPADIEPKATEHIDQIIDMVNKLIDKGLAYEAGGSVYFSVAKLPSYGKLSGRKLEDMIAGARVEAGDEKRDPLDFALWKVSKPGEPFWQSPWGQGRPGWHIECSAMSTHYLGATLDIHGGGRDLIFPHHENETAQSEGVFEQDFVRFWVHNGFVTIDNEKMSKSLGNFMTIRDLLKEVHPEVLRVFLLSRHYRSPIDFSKDAINEAKGALIRFYEMLARVESAESSDSDNLRDAFTGFIDKFEAAMSDDFNSAKAVADLHELTTEVNRSLNENPTVSESDKAAMSEAVALISKIFAILDEEPTAFLEGMKHGKVAEISAEEIEELIEERKQARADKNFARSDEIRDQLKDKGILLKDGPEGTTWETL